MILEKDWKMRMEALNKIQGIVLGNSPIDFKEAFSSFLIKSIIPISSQVYLILIFA